MKVSNVKKMTNLRFARMLKRYVTQSVKKEFPAYAATIDEAARRLCKPTAVDDDLLKMARDIDRLRECLKDAESAIKDLLEIVCVNCQCGYRIDGTSVKCNALVAAEFALETIRTKGGLK